MISIADMKARANVAYSQVSRVLTTSGYPTPQYERSVALLADSVHNFIVFTGTDDKNIYLSDEGIRTVVFKLLGNYVYDVNVVDNKIIIRLDMFREAYAKYDPSRYTMLDGRVSCFDCRANQLAMKCATVPQEASRRALMFAMGIPPMGLYNGVAIPFKDSPFHLMHGYWGSGAAWAIDVKITKQDLMKSSRVGIVVDDLKAFCLWLQKTLCSRAMYSGDVHLVANRRWLYTLDHISGTTKWIPALVSNLVPNNASAEVQVEPMFFLESSADVPDPNWTKLKRLL